jgi:SPP1 gp7 family putative phage head morphogenesis protein
VTGSYSQIRARGVAADALQIANEVAALPYPVLQTIGPLIAQAELETARGLRQWIASGKGEDRFTAREYARVLVQLRSAFDTIRRIEPTLADALGKGASRAGVLSVQHLTSLVDRNSRRFGTSLEAPIRLDLAKVLATGDGLIPRFKASAARYSEGVRDQIRQQLAIGILKGETYTGLIDRLSQRSTIARAAGAEPTATTAASGLLRGADYRLQRLVRTEMAHASDVQTMESFRQARQQIPSLRRQWCAALDMRLCPSCKEMHNAVSGPDGSFSAMLPGPPLHPNCRCVAVPWREAWGEIDLAA